MKNNYKELTQWLSISSIIVFTLIIVLSFISYRTYRNTIFYKQQNSKMHKNEQPHPDTSTHEKTEKLYKKLNRHKNTPSGKKYLDTIHELLPDTMTLEKLQYCRNKTIKIQGHTYKEKEISEFVKNLQEDLDKKISIEALNKIPGKKSARAFVIVIQLR